MAQSVQKIMLSACNVRRIKAGVSIERLADDIARRTLLQSVTVRPVLDAAGIESGMYEIPAGGPPLSGAGTTGQAEAPGQDRACAAIFDPRRTLQDGIAGAFIAVRRNASCPRR